MTTADLAGASGAGVAPGKRTRTERLAGAAVAPRTTRDLGPAARHGHGHRHGPGQPEAASRRNPRFTDNQELEAAESSTDYIQQGDRGMEVRTLQQGLIDAGYDLPGGVSGTFDGDTRDVVLQFQRDQGIGVDGIVGPETMGELHEVHDSHESVVQIAQDHDPANPREGTRALTAEEAAAFDEAIVTEPRTASGGLPTFEPDNAHGNYEARVRAEMQRIIGNMYSNAQAMEAERADPDNLHDWNGIETVAAASKRETDRVFGDYKTGPAFQEGVNLFDAWEQEGDAISSDPSYADWIVRDLASYLLNNDMEDINDQHGAVRSRPTEGGILQDIEDDFVASHRTELLLIQQSWPGLAQGGEVSIQRNKADDDAGNRDFMWEQFATIIHEYIHTLEHPDHVAYRGTMAEQRGGLTLREGMTDYFTKMVWDTIDFNPALRGEVEGPYNAPMSHRIPRPTYYDSATEAERAVGVVGVRNAMGAFFLGQVDLIGGP